MYAFRTSHGPVDLAFTDRYGGVSAVPFDSLNLALETPTGRGDDPVALASNLRLVLDDFAPDAAIADMRQVHGHEVALGAPHEPRADCDGLVTERHDLVLLVRAADCVPVLLADPENRIIGVAHAGRSGLASGVVPATVTRMRLLGATAITAWIGPHVCGGCYEVPAELQREVASVVPASRATTSWGTPSLDLGAGVRSQLERAHVGVVDVARCTRESSDLYSYRRDGADAGRLAGLIRVRG